MYTYDEIINIIDHAHRSGNLTGVEISSAMLEKLENPQQAYPFIHIAGTNGKGSVCSFLDSILQEKGLKVGRFTSPHLVDFEERITVNGKMMPKEDVTRIMNHLLEIDFGLTPTYFDYCLAIAAVYFKEQQVDIAVMETGLGGTLDSTNALGRPLAAVIAKIGFDHTAILGNTLSEIAAHKAGITKPGIPVIMETQEEEAQKVLVSEAERRGASQIIILTQEDIRKASGLNLKIPGVHQWENAALAAKTIETIWKQLPAVTAATAPIITTTSTPTCAAASSPISPSPEDMSSCIRWGLESAAWPGRMELLSSQPFYMVDGAHNGNGVSALTASLKQLYPGEKFHFFMGVLADKDYEAMVDQLLPLALDFHTITPESSRALQADALAEYIRSHGIPATTLAGIPDVPKHLYPDGKNIAFGSLYFVGELKELQIKKEMQIC